MHQRKRIALYLTLLLLLGAALPVFAQTEYTWNGSNASWATASEWTPVGVPGSADGVTVSAGSVTLDGNRTVDHLTLTGSGQVYANGNLTVTSQFDHKNGTLTGDTLTTAIDDTVFVPVGGTLVFSGTSKKDMENIAIINNGTISWTGGNLDLDATNQGRAMIIKNNATFDINLTGERNIVGGSVNMLQNTGTINFANSVGRTQISVSFTNTGAVNASSGTFEIRQASTSTGATYDVSSGAIISFTQATHVMDSVTVQGAGTTELKDTPLTLNGNGLHIVSGGTFNMFNSGSTISGTGDILVDGTFIWDRGRIKDSGAFTVNGTMTVTGQNAKNLARALVNKGTMTWTGGGAVDLETGGSILNDTTGTLTFDNVGDVIQVSGTGIFTNHGTVTKNGGGKTRWVVPLTNHGTFNLLTDSLGVEKVITNKTTGIVGGTGVFDFTNASAGFTNDGHTSPGTSAGILNFVNDFSQTSLGNVDIELGGTTPGTGYDRLDVASTATLTGTLNISLINGFVPVSTDTFEIIKYTSHTGTFSTVNFPHYNHTITYTDTSVLITGVGFTNSAPTAVDDQINTLEDVADTINVLKNDSDIDSDALTISGFTQPPNGTVTQLGDSSFIYQPVAQFFGADSFSYDISDGSLAATATVHITVDSVNDAPVAANIPDVSFNEDGGTTLDLTQYATDVDNDSTQLTWTATVIGAQTTKTAKAKKGDGTIEVTPADLTVSIGAGDVATFSATADSGGVFTVVFTVSDLEPLSDTDTITVTVNSVNDAPVVTSAIGDVSFNEDSGPVTATTDLNTHFSDVDKGTTLSYSAASDNTNITPTVSGTSLSVNASANFNGSGNIIVTASDGSLSVTDTFAVTVNPVNDAPVAANIPDVSFNEDAGTTLDLTQYGSDVDNDSTQLSWTATVIGAQAAKTAKKGGGTIEVTPADLTVSIGAGDVATFSATADSGGVFTVVFTVSDLEPLSDTDTITVTVNSVNDAPVVTSAIGDVSFNEDSGPVTATADLNTNFSDVDLGTTLSYSAASDNAGITATITGASLSVSSTANFAGSGNVIVTASDGSLSVTDTFAVTVNPVNDAPVAANIPDVSFNEDAGTTLDLTQYGSDVDNDSTQLSWTATVIGAQAAKTAKKGGGTIEVTPADLTVSIGTGDVATFSATADSGGVFTVVFTVTDPGTLSDTDTITVTVNSQNDAPVVASAINDVSLNEDSGPVTATADLNANFSDPDPGTTLTFSAASDNADISATITGSSLSVNSSANFNGSGNVVVTASDGSLAVNDTFAVTVNAVNDAPVAANIPDVSFNEDAGTTLDLTQYGSDVDNDSTQLSWTATVIGAQAAKNAKKGGGTIEVTPADLTVSIGAGDVATFSATADSGGVFTVVFTVSDPAPLSDTDTITVTVNSQNDAPVVASAISNISFNEDSGPVTAAADLNTNFSDPDPGTSLIFTATSDTSDISATVTGSSLTVNASANFNGAGNVIVTASDGSLSVTDTFAVTVNAVNDAPIAANIPDVTFPEDGSTTLDLTQYGSDVDNDSTQLSWTATVIAAQPVQVAGRKKGDGTIEVDTGDLTVSIGAGDVATFSTVADSSGIFTVVFTVSDLAPLSDTDTITVTVSGKNDAPVLASAISDVSFNEDAGPVTAAADLNTNFSDPDPGTSLIFTATSDNADISATISGSSLSVNSSANFFGSGNVIVTASDGVLSASDTFAVSIAAVNDAPVAANIPNITFPEDGSATLDITQYGSDVDNDTTQLSWTAAVISAQALQTAKRGKGKPDIEVTPADLTVSIGTGDVTTFSATADSGGVFTVVFTVSDPAPLSDTDTITVTVSPQNDAPVLVSQIPDVSFDEDNGPITAAADLNTNFNDIDPGTTLIFSASADTSGILPTISGTTLTVNTAANFAGSGTVIVTASDGVASVTDTFAVTINPINDAPVISPALPNISFQEDGSAALGLTQFASDVDNTTAELTWSASVLTASGATLQKDGNIIEVTPADLNVTIDQNNVASFSATADSGGVFTVEFALSDPTNAMDKDTITVTVTGVNDAPFVVNPIADFAFNEDSGPATVVDLTTVFSDPDVGATLTYSAVSDTADVQATIVNDTLTLNASANFAGTAQIIATANDGAASVSDTFTVTVVNVNDPPVLSSPLSDMLFSEDSGPVKTTNLNNVFSDIDAGTTLTFSASSDNPDIQATIVNDSASVTSTLNYSGSAEVVVTASDGFASVTDTFSVTILPVNDAPVASLPDVFFGQDSSTTLDLDQHVTDVDNDTTQLLWQSRVLTANSGDVAKGGGNTVLVDTTNLQVAIDPVTHVATFTTSQDSLGIFTVEFTVSDPGALADKDTITVTVVAVSRPPFLANNIVDLNFPEDSGPVVAASDLNNNFSDPDAGTTLIFSASSNNVDIQASITNTTLNIDASPDYFGGGSVIVTASDGALSVTDTFDVTVTPVNDAPTAAGIPDVTFPEDSSTTLDLTAFGSDVDNDSTQLSWSATVISAQSLQPLVSKNAEEGVNVDPGDLTVSIGAGDVATFSATSDSGGVFTVVFTVSDPEPLSGTDTITVTVVNQNDAPTLANAIPDLNFNEDEGPATASTDLNSVFSDPDPGTALVFSAISDNADIQPSISGDTLSVNATADYNGDGAIVVTASDGVSTATDTFSVTVLPVNDAPVLANWPVSIEILEDDSISFDLDTLVTDVDNTIAELTFGFAPSDPTIQDSIELTIDPVTHVVKFVPDKNFFIVGAQLFVTVTDPGALADSDTINFSILPVNDPPEFLVELGRDTVYVDSTASGNVWEIVADPETPSSQLTYEFTVNAAELIFTYDDQTGDVTITPAAGFLGVSTASIKVSDPEGLFVEQSLEIFVDVKTGIDDLAAQLPTTFDIAQNYPNPFNPSTTLKFQLPNASDVRLTIYSILGQKVRTLLNGKLEAGYHEVVWDGRNNQGVQQASGLYIYRFTAGNFSKTLKMTFMK